MSQSRVSVNGSAVKQASQKIVLGKDMVEVDGAELLAFGHLYIIMHKPAGYVCARSDADHPTLLDLVCDQENFLGSREEYSQIQASTLQIVGRLDIDTTGMILLTNDGAWNHRMSSPGKCAKTYIAELAEPINDRAITLFKEGILLKSETKPTKSAKLNILAPKQAEITLAEGRYHQVKRMFAALNNRVTNLKRTAIGPLKLEHAMAPGSFRCLSIQELESLGQNYKRSKCEQVDEL